MLTMKMPIHSKRLPVALLAIVAVLLLSFGLASPASAAEPIPPHVDNEGRMLRVQGPRQILRDDLTVEGGQVIEDDVLVYDGNVEVKDGGRITGNLVVFSGNIEIDEGSVVEGNATAYSGNVTVAGHVGGNIANFSGDVELASTARVDGDISVVSGSIERDEGASVSGNVVQGPSFRFPGVDAPDAPRAPAGVSFRADAPSFFGRIISLVGRILAAALMTAFVMLLVGGLFYLRPQLIADTRKQLQDQLALSAVVGLAVNLTGFFLAWLLAITLCLFPVALVLMLLLFAVNIVGWAVASQIVGERIVTVAKQGVQPALTILVGALFLTGGCALLWAFGGCFRPLAFLLLLVVASLGTGAALLPWINRRRGIGGTGSDGGGSVPPRGPVPSGAAPTNDTPVETDVAAPLDYVTAEEINAARGGTVAASAQDTILAQTESGYGSEGNVVEREVVEHDVAAPIDYMTAEEINATAEQPPLAAPKPASRSSKPVEAAAAPSPSAPGDDPVELDASGPIDYLTAQEVITTDTVTEGDDFLRIKGIGPTYARRLKDAGYATFAQLAAASTEEIAAAIGWPVDRVRRAEVVDQAKVLAQ